MEGKLWWIGARYQRKRIPARFKLIYKNAMFIGSLRIDSPAIGYGMILLPFALLISRFWKPFKGLQRATDKWDDRRWR